MGKQDYLDLIRAQGFPCISNQLEMLWDYPEVREAFRRLVFLDDSNPQKPKLPYEVQEAIIKLFNLRFTGPEDSDCPWKETFYK